MTYTKLHIVSKNLIIGFTVKFFFGITNLINTCLFHGYRGFFLDMLICKALIVYYVQYTDRFYIDFILFYKIHRCIHNTDGQKNSYNGYWCDFIINIYYSFGIFYPY
jgi:hypothetical protein